MRISIITSAILLAGVSLGFSGCDMLSFTQPSGNADKHNYSTAVSSRVLSPSDGQCPNGGIEVFSGIDENGNGRLDTWEQDSEKVLCNGEDGTNGVDGEDGTNGVDGEDGINGFTTLLNTTPLSVGDATCSNGGTAISIGLDLNRNGVLDANESGLPQYVCNGTNGTNGIDGIDGIDGVNGIDGQDGINGFTTLTNTTPLSVGDATCSNGGTAISIGLDLNRNGVLDANESGLPQYVCNGVDGQDGVDGENGFTTLISNTNLAVGNANCMNGGTEILFGLDINRNGVLDANESNTPHYVCNGADGVDANTAPIIHTLYASPAYVQAGASIDLGAVVTDPDNGTLHFVWRDANNSQISTDKTTTTTAPTAAGAYLYSFTATDDDNNTITGYVNVQVDSEEIQTATTIVVTIGGDSNSSDIISLPRDVRPVPVTGSIEGTLIVAGSNEEVAGVAYRTPSFGYQTAQEILNNDISVLSSHLFNDAGATFNNISTRNLSSNPLMSSGVTANYLLTLQTPTKPVDLIKNITELIGSNIQGGTVTTSFQTSATAPASTSYKLATTVQYFSDNNVMTRIAVVDQNNSTVYEGVVNAIINPGAVTVPGMISDSAVETFTARSQATSQKADFLFVIDNSGSMSSYQDAVRTASTEFANALSTSNLDYHIGIISTDRDTLFGNGIIDNNITEFQNTVTIGTNGSGTETGIYYAERALQNTAFGDAQDGTLAQVGFPRADASLSIILLSDERSQYTDRSNGVPFDVNNNLFVDRGYIFYSIIDPNDDGQYIDLSDVTHGTSAPISNTTVFSNIMTEIATNAGATTNGYRLSSDRFIDASSINVSVNGNIVAPSETNGWTYHEASKSIIFHGNAIPTEGSNIQVAYNYNRFAQITALSLSIDANATFYRGDQIDINVNGTFEDNSTGVVRTLNDMNITSSNSSVISVNNNTLRAEAAGTSDITFTTAQGVSSTISIPVADYPTLALNQVTTGRSVSAGEIRKYRIDLNTSGTLSVTSLSSYDTYGYLYDANMTEITSDDDGGANANFLIQSSLNAGTYYIGVGGYGNQAVSAYDLNSTFQ